MSADIDRRVRDSFSRQRFMGTLGAEVVSVGAGTVVLRLPFREELGQQNGFLHAGAIATLADSACGYAALTTMPPDADVLSVEFKINMLSPAVGDAFEARAQVLRAGRTIVVTRADVFALRDSAEKLVAAMQGTMIVSTQGAGRG
jgi:uncharacterized protein (TIGR00369 family)